MSTLSNQPTDPAEGGTEEQFYLQPTTQLNLQFLRTARHKYSNVQTYYEKLEALLNQIRHHAERLELSDLCEAAYRLASAPDDVFIRYQGLVDELLVWQGNTLIILELSWGEIQPRIIAGTKESIDACLAKTLSLLAATQAPEDLLTLEDIEAEEDHEEDNAPPDLIVE